VLEEQEPKLELSSPVDGEVVPALPLRRPVPFNSHGNRFQSHVHDLHQVDVMNCNAAVVEALVY